ncbi:MAG: sulfurtransferase, partial [Bacteroidota bacterium]
MSTTNYANPDVLVTTDWVAQHLDDKSVRLIEVDVDTTQYETGHIRGAMGWNWQTQLQDPVRRDIISKEQLEKYLSQAGITDATSIILYGDNNNWFAAYAFWLLQYYGHNNVKLMNGGRKKWVAENRDLTTAGPSYQPTKYQVMKLEPTLRATREYVFNILDKKSYALVDVRSVDEYTGKVIAPPGMTETAQRGGHIPGAKSIPWSQAVNEDGTFKSYADLKALYEGKGVTSDKDEVVAYCRIGERSSHSWFVLKYLLGYPKVRNYDGSWTEWGNLVNAP